MRVMPALPCPPETAFGSPRLRSNSTCSVSPGVRRPRAVPTPKRESLEAHDAVPGDFASNCFAARKCGRAPNTRRRPYVTAQPLGALVSGSGDLLLGRAIPSEGPLAEAPGSRREWLDALAAGTRGARGTSLRAMPRLYVSHGSVGATLWGSVEWLVDPHGMLPLAPLCPPAEARYRSERQHPAASLRPRRGRESSPLRTELEPSITRWLRAVLGSSRSSVRGLIQKPPARPVEERPPGPGTTGPGVRASWD